MIERYAEKLMEDLLEQKDAIIFGQLNNLVRDGVLRIEQTEAVLVQDQDTNTIKLQQAVRLTFDAESVIENYRKKTERLSKKLMAVQEILNGSGDSEEERQAL